jgi:hypothetical protein
LAAAGNAGEDFRLRSKQSEIYGAGARCAARLIGLKAYSYTLENFFPHLSVKDITLAIIMFANFIEREHPDLIRLLKIKDFLPIN